MVVLTSSRGILITLLLGSLALVLLASTTWGENTAPRVEMSTPDEDALLGLAVTVSGKATDSEGFNVDSYVEARWNDWEWFRLPNTPADGNRSIVFGEMVNLDWHAPGGHLLQVRAFDGELFSPVARVNVTVRDLPDLVILPTDITIDPEDAREGGGATISVKVRNQGGEDVPDVEVVLFLNDQEVGRSVLDQVAAHSDATPSFAIGPEEGINTFRVSVFPLQPIEERTRANNQAERSFNIRGPVLIGDDWGSQLLINASLCLVVVVALVLLYTYVVVTSRKD